MFAALDPKHILGCVVHIAAEVRAPGEVHHTGGTRLILGEPDRSLSARLARVADALDAAGFATERSPDIRLDVWIKLLGNLSFNPVAALTGYLMNQIVADDDVLGVIRAHDARRHGGVGALRLRDADDAGSAHRPRTPAWRGQDFDAAGPRAAPPARTGRDRRQRRSNWPTGRASRCRRSGTCTR